MALTIPVPLSVTVWTEISQGLDYGFFTNGSDRYIVFVTSDVLPGPAQRGHRLNPGENMQYSLSGSEKVYARAIFKGSSPDTVYVTAGYNGFFNGGPLSKEFKTEVNKGNVPGHIMVYRLGRLPSVDNADFEEVRWLGGISVPLQTASTMQAISTSAADTNLTGANTWNIKIFGVDQNFNAIDEIINMAGLVQSSPTIQAFLRVHFIEPVTNGSFNVRNLGDITISDTATGTPQIVMPAGSGLSKSSHYTVPAGKTGYLEQVVLEAEAKQDKQASFRLLARLNELTPGPPWLPTAEVHTWVGVNGIVPLDISARHIVPERTDIWFESVAELDGVPVGVSYELLLVDN